MRKRPRRIMLYSTGRSGIGQTVRALKLAHYVSEAICREVEILIVTGVALGDRLFRSSRWTVVAPSQIVRLVTAVANGAEADRLVTLRPTASQVVASLAADFQPDVFVTTSHRGVAGEISEIVPRLRESGCRLILALRDIYYPPEYADDFKSMSVDAFDVVLIGGPSIVSGWAPPGLLEGSLAARTGFVGYLPPPSPLPGDFAAPGDRFMVRCQVGGGRDGASLARVVVEAAELVRRRLSHDVDLDLATGPLMPRCAVRALKSMSSNRTRVGLWYEDGMRDTRRMARRADVVVSMAGYNSCVEAAWFRTSSIVVPRGDPDDLEQAIRAKLFSRWFSNIDVVSYADPEVLADKISALLLSKFCSYRPLPSVLSDKPDSPDSLFARPRDVALTIIGR